MATWKPENSLLTDVGEEILNKLNKGTGDSITITRIVAGSGRVSASALHSQTALTGSTKDMTPLDKRTIEGGSEISFYIDNTETNFPARFSLQQIGIYVSHPDYSTEQLYHISQCEEDEGDVIPESADTPLRLSYSLFLSHSGSDAITLNVDPAGVVTREAFEEFKKEVVTNEAFEAVETEIRSYLGNLNTNVTNLSGAFNSFKAGVKGKSKFLITPDANGNLIASGKSLVSGSSFTIKDAITHRALSLSIEGKSTQATEPTPASPVYLVNTKVSYIRNSDGGSVNSKLISFPSGTELRSLGDYKDTIEWDGSKWWKVQRIQELVLDGVKNGVYSSEGQSSATYCRYALTVGTLYKTIKDHITSAPIKASHGNYPADPNTAEFYAFHYSSSNAICGHFLNTLTGVTSTQTATEKGATINAWLKAQYDAGTPVKVWYVLKTPIVTEISLTEVLEMYANNTSITCSAEGSTPNMVLGYALNTTDDTTMYILRSLARKSDVQTANTFAVATIVE